AGGHATAGGARDQRGRGARRREAGPRGRAAGRGRGARDRELAREARLPVRAGRALHDAHVEQRERLGWLIDRRAASRWPDRLGQARGAPDERAGHAGGPVPPLRLALLLPAPMKDATSLPLVVASLRPRGYADGDVRKILGENFRRLLSALR